MIGSSAALTISDIPFQGPIGSVRVGRIDGQFVLNPGYELLEQSEMNIVMSGTQDAVVMIEGEAREISEADLKAAVEWGHGQIQQIIAMQHELCQQLDVTKKDVAPKEIDEEFAGKVSAFAKERILQSVYQDGESVGKELYQSRIDQVYDDALEAFNNEEEAEDKSKLIGSIIHDVEKDMLRASILNKGKRADGRSLTDIRQITCEVGVLPRTHGSAVFTRGETQALVVTTLGTSMDEQRLDKLEGESSKSFMLHYNFPPYSVGEVKFLRGPGRREIGHGTLAERALEEVMPSAEEFPYTVRVVSDILESNGSSSMATVCGGTLALMDAGIQIKAPVAGIAMGLIAEGDKFAVLSDIAGLEDHLGDMDFKVAGTAQGITAIQMDLKVCGITLEIFATALEQARQGRLFILDKMLATLADSRGELSPYAPRITTMQIDKDKIRTVIGPGGKMIRSIIEETGVKIDIDDDGTVHVASSDGEAAAKAIGMIERLVEEVQEGKIYVGLVKSVVDFGAFVEILPGTEGLLHISQIAEHRVNKVSDELAEGDEVMVKVLNVDGNRIKLSRKAALKEHPGQE
jgi:polyribonucleotide nucleotidyltransferase